MFDFKKNSKKLKSENKAEASSLSIRLKQTRASLFGMLFSKKTPIDDTIINELEDRFLLADVGIKTTDLIIQLLTDTIKINISPQLLSDVIIFSTSDFDTTFGINPLFNICFILKIFDKFIR